VCSSDLAISFAARWNAAPQRQFPVAAFSRRAFLASSAAGVAAAVAVRAVPGAQPRPLRPPGSVPEARFLELCIRCGHCIQVCPGPVLRAAGFDCGLDALWTPVAVLSHAGCHQDCNFCTQVCPTGAIRPLPIEVKRKTHMGLAVIDTQACLPHRGDQDCQLCYDECNAAGYRAIEMRSIKLPMGRVPEGAFSSDELEEMARIAAPFVNQDACVGCGLCEYRCQSANAAQRKLLRQSAVTIVADNADRTL
jgi:NAD-dependent dihydropyrimidine dehydrogenase PreA subunit